MTTLDEALSTVASVHRRRVLVALLDHNPRTVAGLSASEDVHAVDMESEDVQIQMYHTHLPKLEDGGFITWDRDDSQVVKGPEFDEIEPLLELLADDTDRSPDEDRP